mmetsp:Transcript_3091/g.6750  ORF Transcript_3091/g.6750 Transcript_3091/m.6750 type:complete len:207 (+) Transcript_3091:146-766(+)
MPARRRRRRRCRRLGAGRYGRGRGGGGGLVVADAEVLHLAVAHVSARHDVELALDAARDVPRVDLGLSVVDELEAGVDGVAGEVAHQVAVPADGAADVVVELAVDAEVEALARAGLADGEGAARLEALLLEHRRGEADVGEPRDDGRRAVEVGGARDGRDDGGGDVLEHAAHGVGRGVLAGDEGGGAERALGLGLEGADLGLQLLG